MQITIVHPPSYHGTAAIFTVTFLFGLIVVTRHPKFVASWNYIVRPWALKSIILIYVFIVLSGHMWNFIERAPFNSYQEPLEGWVYVNESSLVRTIYLFEKTVQ